MSTLIDISRPLQASLAMWPGDTAYQFTSVLRLSDGATVNLGAATLSMHAGTHVDAPLHFDGAAPAVDELSLDAFCGPAWVADVTSAAATGTIAWEALAGLDFARYPRLILRTGAWRDDRRFPESIPTLHPDVPARLGTAGVRLIGLDVPSVDALDSKTLPVHHALWRAGVLILESLQLAHVALGPYRLMALPLRIVGADASPVRAVLEPA